MRVCPCLRRTMPVLSRMCKPRDMPSVVCRARENAMSVRRRILGGPPALVAACVLAAGCAGTGVDKAGGARAVQPVTLRMVTPLSSEELLTFVAAAKRLSGGTIRIIVEGKWHVGEPGAEPASIRYVQAGNADLGGAPVRAWDGVGVPTFDALIAPLEIDSYSLQARVLGSDLVGPMLNGMQRLGLTGLGVQPGPMRRPVGIRRDLVGPADYRKAALAIGGSEVASRTFGALGAISTPFAFQGKPIVAFDGSEQQIASVEGNQYDGVARSITANVGLWPRPIVLFGNSAALRRLAPKQRTALHLAAQESIRPVLTQTEAGETEATANLCRRGKLEFVSATAQQLADLHAATDGVRTWLRSDAITRRALEGIEALRTEMATEEPERAPSCSGAIALAPPRPSTAGVLDGVYTQTISAKDLLAAGSPDADPANYGTTTLVVDRGRFAFTGVNGPTVCGHGFGSWTVKGQTVEWLFAGGGVQGSNAANKPGELFVYGWSLFRDTLTFSRITGATPPEGAIAKPWTRVSRTPSRSALGHRCPPPRQALT